MSSRPEELETVRKDGFVAMNEAFQRRVTCPRTLARNGWCISAQVTTGNEIYSIEIGGDQDVLRPRQTLARGSQTPLRTFHLAARPLGRMAVFGPQGALWSRFCGTIIDYSQPCRGAGLIRDGVEIFSLCRVLELSSPAKRFRRAYSFSDERQDEFRLALEYEYEVLEKQVHGLRWLVVPLQQDFRHRLEG